MKIKNKLLITTIATLGIGGISYSQVVIPDSAASGKRNNNRQDTTLSKVQKDTIKKPDSVNNSAKKSSKIPETDTVIPPKDKFHYEIKSGKMVPLRDTIR